MTGSVVITTAASLESPSTTSKSSAVTPAQSDEGQEFNKVLSEQTAKALEGTDDHGRASDKPSKRSKSKGEPVSTNADATKSSLTHATHLATPAPSPSGVGPATFEDRNPSTAGTPSRDVEGRVPTAALPSSSGAAEVNEDASPANVSLPGATIKDVDDREASAPVADETIEAVAPAPTSNIARSVVSDEATPQPANNEGRETPTPTIRDSAIPPMTSSTATTTPPPTVSTATATATATTATATATATATNAFSDIDSAALRAAFATENASPSPESRTATPSSSTTESTPSSTPSAHRSDDTAVAVTSTSGAPSLTWAGAVRTASMSQPNALASGESSSAPSLDVTDLATSISQAVFGADGSYTLNVAMHPNELGHVQAVVSLNGDDLHVAITAQTSTGHEALSNAVDSLKSELSRGGLNVNVSLRDPESQAGSSHEEPKLGSSYDEDAPDVMSGTEPAGESLTVSQIHLIL